MKSLLRIVTVIMVFNMAIAGFALAQDAAEEAGEQATQRALGTAHRQVEAAQKQLEAARRKAEAAEVTADLAANLAGKQTESVSANIPLIGHLYARQHTGDRAILVIPTAEMKPDDFARMAEDLNIMARIVDKKLNRPLLLGEGKTIIFGGLHRYNRGKTLLSGDDRATKAIYVQGYGTVFLTRVDFPLSPPPQINVGETQEPADPFWEQTKREIQATARAKNHYKDRTVNIESLKSLPAEQFYDAEKVEELQRNLTKALKHAANIRNLPPDEWVVLVVKGAPMFVELRVARSQTGQDKITTITPIVRKEGSPTVTVLTIRAKKSDVDAFSKTDLDFDEFRKRTRTSTYQQVSGKLDTTNTNSWF